MNICAVQKRFIFLDTSFFPLSSPPPSFSLSLEALFYHFNSHVFDVYNVQSTLKSRVIVLIQSVESASVGKKIQQQQNKCDDVCWQVFMLITCEKPTNLPFFSASPPPPAISYNHDANRNFTYLISVPFIEQFICVCALAIYKCCFESSTHIVSLC